MLIYAEFDQAGLPLGFYSDEVHGPLEYLVWSEVAEGDYSESVVIGVNRNPAYPANVVEISSAMWRELLDNPGRRRWRNGALMTVAEPIRTPPAVREISDWQFFTQLALDGVITEEEAEATSNGTMPAMLLQAIETEFTAPAERFKARMLAMNATTFEQDHPAVRTIAAVLKWSPARLQKLWTDASKL